MKKLTKTQLKKIASIHAGTLILVTEPSIVFSECNLSMSELSTLEIYFEQISARIRNGESAIFDSNIIVDYVRKNCK